jgi:cytochrome P450
LKVINAFIEKYIERTISFSPAELETKTKSSSGYNFLHALGGFTHDRKMLRDQLTAVLLAGRDTTASTLSWVFYELARHPETFKKLRQEIIDSVGTTNPPTYEDLKNMKYLQYTMNETLRLYPVVPFNVRMALKDTTLPHGGGPDGRSPVGILKDTPIGYSVLVMQRREDLYPPNDDPRMAVEYFNPDRWATWQPKPWTYIPFNGGPRLCIGQQFALTNMGYTIVRMLQRFDRVDSFMPEGPNGKPVMKAEIVLQPGEGVHTAFWEASGEKE